MRNKINSIILLVVFIIAILPINIVKAHSNIEYYYDDFKSMTLIIDMKKNVKFDNYNIEKVTYIDSGLATLSFSTIEDTIKCYEAIKNNKNINFIEPNIYIEFTEDEVNDIVDEEIAMYNSWGIEHLEIDKYVKYLIEEDKDDIVTVAVVDTGIDYNHPIFKDKLLDDGYDFINNDSDPFDDNYSGHGTHVAGIIADATRELNNIKILPIKAVDSVGYGTALTIGNSIKYAIECGVDIINLSLGISSGAHSQFLENAILEAVEAGITVINAAGNSNVNTMERCPAHIDEAIIVSSIDSENNKAYTSNYGPNIDVAAPGEAIYSSLPGGRYGYKSGTSMAAPHITAIAAMLKLDNYELKPSEIENLIKDYSVDIGEDGVDWLFGSGIPKMTIALPNVIDEDNLAEDIIMNEESEIQKSEDKTVELTYLDTNYNSEVENEDNIINDEDINDVIIDDGIINYGSYNYEVIENNVEESINMLVGEASINEESVVNSNKEKVEIYESMTKIRGHENSIIVIIFLIVIIYIANITYKKLIRK